MKQILWSDALFLLVLKNIKNFVCEVILIANFGGEGFLIIYKILFDISGVHILF